MHAASYLGVVLKNSRREVIGHLAVIDDRPNAGLADLRSLAILFAERTAASWNEQRVSAHFRRLTRSWRRASENASGRSGSP
jgi:hypothetical protein